MSIAYGRLASLAGEELPIKVMKSNAGFYIGTSSNDGSPFSRESVEYYNSKEKADEALKFETWTQRVNF